MNSIFTPWELESVGTEKELFQKAANETDQSLFVSVKIKGKDIPVSMVASSLFGYRSQLKIQYVSLLIRVHTVR